MASKKKSEGAAVVGEIQVSNEVVSFGKQKKVKSQSSAATQVEGSYSKSIQQGSKVLATPAARALASKMSIDINAIQGTGPNSRVLISDIKNATHATPEVVKTAVEDKQFHLKPTPLAQAIAKDKNVDLSKLAGTGMQNRIVSSDVEKAISQPVASTTSVQPSAPAAVQPPVISTGEDRREKTTPMRKAIAKAMKTSWSTVAYTNLVLEIDVTKLWDLRKAIKDQVLKTTGVKITFLPYIVKAINIALKDFPLLNSVYDETTSEIVYKNDINIGIAVDTPAGLVVPVVHHADQKNMLTVAQEIGQLAKAARDKKLTNANLTGGTFTITNYGSVGALHGVPVIYYPQMAIAGVGAIIDRVYWKNNAAVPGKVMHLTVAGDHRWVDGAEIGRFGYRVKTLLENPDILGLY